MNLLPFENIIYKTSLKETEVIKRLNFYIEPDRTFRFRTDSVKPYRGELTGNKFNIRRVIRYRNSFMPHIKGTIEKDITGTTIAVQMRLHRYVLLFMAVWLGIAAFNCIAFFTAQPIPVYLTEPDLLRYVPFAMLLFGTTLTLGAFKYESMRSRKDLQRLFEAEIIG